ncbi:MAG: response regulator [Elusimicrobiota bacterium]|jgi:DNA-binding response OmpR family regulator
MTALIIDDEPHILRICRRILDNLDTDSLEGRCVADGIQQIRSGKRFDILISDLRLPDGSGWSVISEFRGLSPKTPIVVITGTPDEWDPQLAETLKVDACIFKPFDINDFRNTVGRLLRRTP